MLSGLSYTRQQSDWILNLRAVQFWAGICIKQGMCKSSQYEVAVKNICKMQDKIPNRLTH